MQKNKQQNLFTKSYTPLAESLRPKTWEEFQGLDQLDKSLIKQLQEGMIPPSLILWGSPGCGKTTLARLIGEHSKLGFIEFSGVLSGVKEIREIVQVAKNKPQPTLLFVDEIHRFNKNQQDAFLPHIENGTIILIGATTQNPSFDLNSALLSRCKVITLSELSKENLSAILLKAENEHAIKLDNKAKDFLIAQAGGDARRLIGFIEQLPKSTEISLEELKSAFSNSGNFFYDASGDEHYNMASAFIKSMRGSDVNAAMYWGFRMLESGEDPRFLIRRMIIFASEDIGNAAPNALVLATSTLHAYEAVGLPEARIPIAQCIEYLAKAKKANSSYALMNKVLAVIKKHIKVSVPIHLRNAPTKLMKELGYGKDYKYPHNYGGYIEGERYLPEEVERELK